MGMPIIVLPKQSWMYKDSALLVCATTFLCSLPCSFGSKPETVMTCVHGQLMDTGTLRNNLIARWMRLLTKFTSVP